MTIRRLIAYGVLAELLGEVIGYLLHRRFMTTHRKAPAAVMDISWPTKPPATTEETNT